MPSVVCAALGVLCGCGRRTSRGRWRDRGKGDVGLNLTLLFGSCFF